MADPRPYPGMPRWVKVFATIGGVMVLLIVILMLAVGGPHGPGRHMPSGDAGGSPPSSVTPDGAQQP